MFHQFIIWLSGTIGHWGYPGIVILMALESSFFPFPSEIVIPPAAYLAAGGKLNIAIVVFCGTAGSLAGALFNFWIALKFGRPFFEKYGRYLFISRQSLEKVDLFFSRHGHFSTFVGRLLPGIRQYISLPAGLARMNLLIFSGATFTGAAIWVMVLAGLGYWFGQNEQLVLQHLKLVSLILVGGSAALVIIYLAGRKIRSGLHKESVVE